MNRYEKALTLNCNACARTGIGKAIPRSWFRMLLICKAPRRYICCNGDCPCSGRLGEQSCPEFCLAVEVSTADTNCGLECFHKWET